MIGRVRKLAVRDELDQLVVPIPHRIPFAVLSFMQAGAQQFPRLFAIIERRFPIPPAVGGKKQRHRKILLPVRGRPVRQSGSVRRAGPGEITGILSLRHVHVFHGPFP
ncbi:hypothetical protein D1872_250960 [compost metagenome]